MDTSTFEGLTDEDLDRIAARARDATPGPSISFIEGRGHDSGSSFIQTPTSDIELSAASVGDQDFIAHAREGLARLFVEVRRRRERSA